MRQVDLNCDMGESYGVYTLGADELMYGSITSANIACGFHAGDPSVMRSAVRQAIAHRVKIGAHPGLPDLIGFGRRKMEVIPDEVYDMITYQVGALQAFAMQEGSQLHHVKPHGALYNMAAVSPALADAIAQAVHTIDSRLILYGLAGSELIAAGQRAGLSVANEVFADRTYTPDGTLTPRSAAGALITDSALAVKQVLQMVMEQQVISVAGTVVPIQADTICLHGDNAHAVTFARELREQLEQQHIVIQAVSANS
ncbi:LamB/YcsF family protein [Paenibacillus bovis]|uniref:5-oxoprolinase subunit A n=1 Tax=Paenibacillus bovis TaxID=1616788 RepID=A0A172ZHZ5_9BACL|nr:5-oxoprolinase subunit PxpA [Paenibacillus bovis]ANF96770.1 lactam utilization protein LamB [Paenibacillus bovis]